MRKKFYEFEITTTDDRTIVLSQSDMDNGQNIQISVDQVSFLINLLSEAKKEIEENSQ